MDNHAGFGFCRRTLIFMCLLLFLFTSVPAALAQSSSAGEPLFKEKCGICHSLDRALNRFDPTESWEKVVSRQRAKAPFWVSAEEGRAITGYLDTRGKIVSSGRPDLLPEQMQTRQSVIVVEPASRMNPNVSEARFNTAKAAYAANELFLSGVPFFEKITQLGLPTDKDLVTITSEDSFWYSRYGMSALQFESGMGLHLLQSRRTILQSEEEGISPKEFYDGFLARVQERTGLTSPPAGVYPVFAEFASGDPELTQLPNFQDYSTLRWNPQKFDKTISLGALGQALYNQTLWAEYFFGSKHGENLLGNDATEGYLGALLVAEAVNKMHFLISEAAFDGKKLGQVNPFSYEAKLLYYPRQIAVDLSYPDDAPPIPESYAVLDPTSTLFDQASLLLGASEFYYFSDPKVEDNWDAVFGSPAEGALFPPEPHNSAKGLSGVVLKNIVAMHYNPVRQTFVSTWANGERGKTIAAADAGLVLVALKNTYTAFHDDEEIRQGARKMLERQAEFLFDYLQLPDGGFANEYNLETSAHSEDPRKLVTQALAIRGLLAAYAVTEDQKYQESAMSALNFMNEKLWSPDAKIYRSEEEAALSHLSPMDMGATLGALREVVLARKDEDVLRKFMIVFISVLQQNGMQLAELTPTGEKFGSVADVMTPDSDSNGVRKPQFAGGRFGVAPVLAGQIAVPSP
ncbi:MAG: hypothetical protein C4520_12630 [Candidatus Abyssobacteria bacterium SURF_5]|uniref:Cytochrome c domain-containing protein n=1 Tax=Abyssobacteria bacterium (strain SURF_5) TaxID=2093360 RepID=A0A3A4NUS4_ABYX5|nr:MAG: hypothetical protein C4520_12630 [Candidatus Abyssubacteria bacterium SURF_5]